jgi:L-ascorbate metabolism protein UlaG (beta-lactamase superfamily)
MIKPVLQDDAFLADVMDARNDVDHLHLWWLGQSGFLLQWQNSHLLLDPYLSDSLTQKYAATDKPHVRMTERVVAPERFDFIDVVTSSHNHTDHLDKETLAPILAANPKIELIIPEANREFVVDRLGIVAEQPRGLDAGQSATVCGFKITAVPAAHNLIEKDQWGRHKYLGYIVQAGSWTIYHSGDTKLYDDMEARLTSFNIDIALLPINGDYPQRRVAGNLCGREAVLLAKKTNVRLVIPCHYDMFEFNTVTTDEFVEAAHSLHQPYCILRAGERWSSSGLSR